MVRDARWMAPSQFESFSEAVEKAETSEGEDLALTEVEQQDRYWYIAPT